MSSIRITSVVKKYGESTALQGLDVEVADGEFLALLGPSGCGKTTLLRAIAGLETIEGGEIHIGNRLVSAAGYTMAPEKRELGLIFQSYALWPHMKVFGNIAYSLKIRGWKNSAIRARVAEVLDLVGLGGLQDRYPSELSGGQMQRVAVARSVAPQPKVLLFDEPLSNLDAKLRERMRYELRQIQQQVGTTAVYVTHDQSEAMVISDRIVLMNAGSIVQTGSARDMYERPTTAFAADFLGVSNFIDAEVVDEPDANGQVRLVLPGGVHITGSLPAELATIAGSVTVAFRPEHILLGPEPRRRTGAEGSWNTVSGRIEELVYAGNLADVFLRVGDVRLRVQAFPTEIEGLAIGDEIPAHIATEHVRLVQGTKRGEES